MRPPITAALAVATLAVACSRPASDAPQRVSGILITLDTTRADALGCYGGPTGLTPALNAFARECVVFDAARTVTPVTLPAHASMLTGLYPSGHGLRDNGRGALPDAAVTLAELAHDEGYATAAFVAAVVLDRTWGLAQGFDDWSEPHRRAGDRRMVIARFDGFEVLADASAWLRARDRTRPFLLWVHLFDAHAPYEATGTHLAAAGGDAYLGGVAKLDEIVGRLLDLLRAEELLDETLVAIVGDHGEGLWEHGEPSHSVLCYDSTMRVPMLVRPPGGVTPGTEQRRAEPVSVVDVFPTFVAALDLAGAPANDGYDLLAGPRPTDGVMLESWVGYLNYGWAPLVGWAGDDLKVLFACDAVEAYDTSADPDELHDLAADPARAAAIAAAREATRAVLDRAPLAAQHGEVDEALLADIRGLGYAGGGEPLPDLPPALEPCGLPNPSARAEHIGEYERALELADQRRHDEAIAILQALREANDRDAQTRDALARLFFIAERWEECADVTEELLVLHPDHVGLRRSAGACYEHLGRLDDAARHYRRATEIDPDNERARADLERVTRDDE